MTNQPRRTIIEYRGPAAPTDLEVCLMLTRVFFGKEDLLMALGLTRIANMRRKGVKTEEDNVEDSPEEGR